MALLEVLTRCYRRPQMLMTNISSMTAQSISDWEQAFLVDSVGLGIGASYKRMAHFEPVGEWVWILDDDDMCVHDGLTEDVQRIADSRPDAQVIMVRMDHGDELGVLPDEHVWQKEPVMGHLGVSSYIVRRDVWQRHKAAFASGTYASDFDFIADVWREQPVVVWHDVIASRVQRISHGVTE